jgi:hypothetical protein
MIAETLAAILVGKAADLLLHLRKEAKDARIIIDESGFRDSLEHHLKGVETWCESITLLALLRDKRLQDSFTELNLKVGYTRFGPEAAPPQDVMTIMDVYREAWHAALLGAPGAGKTTSLKRIAQVALNERNDGQGGVPILVRLRDISANEPIVSFLLSELGIGVWSNEKTEAEVTKWRARTLVSILERINAILLLDGLDEVDPNCRLEVEDDIAGLIRTSQHLRVIVTCRTAEFQLAVSRLQPYTIQPLSPSQVASFAGRWLGEERAPSFVKAVEDAPYAGTEVVPLTLAHYCALYERYGELPEKPLDVYEQIVSLFIEDWDRQRGLTRKSQYTDFPPRKKERFLQAVAYQLTTRGARGSFLEEDLLVAYDAIATDFSLPANCAKDVVQEVESHTGLLIQSGFRRFEFFHLTIQEYLTAMYAQRTPSAIQTLFPKYPDELALVVAASANASEYLSKILQELLATKADSSRADAFLTPFFSRLAAERARFSPSAELGWIVMALLTLCANLDVNPANGHKSTKSGSKKIRSVNDRPLQAGRSWRSAFVDVPEIQRSFSTAFKNAVVHVADQAVWVTPRNYRERFPETLVLAQREGRISRMIVPIAILPTKKK